MGIMTKQWCHLTAELFLMYQIDDIGTTSGPKVQRNLDVIRLIRRHLMIGSIS